MYSESKKEALSLGNKLLDEREKRHLTQEQLSDKIGINRKTYSKYETGETDISALTLSKIAGCYKISTDYLLGISESTSTDVKAQASCNYIGCSSKAHDALRSRYMNDIPVTIQNGDILESRKKVYKIILDELLSLQNRQGEDESFCFDDLLCAVIIEKLLLNTLQNDNYGNDYVEYQKDRVFTYEAKVKQAFDRLLESCAKRIMEKFSLSLNEESFINIQGEDNSRFDFDIIEKRTNESIFPSEETAMYLSISTAYKTWKAFNDFTKTKRRETDERQKLISSYERYKNELKGDADHAEEE